MCDDSMFDDVGTVGAPPISEPVSSDQEQVAADSDRRLPVVDFSVEVATEDGICDAVLCRPSGDGRWPAVLIWPDVVGLRPVFRAMARRLAADGYVVLVPNPFYRWSRAPVVEGAENLSDPDVRATVFALAKRITVEGAHSDTRAFLSFLDAHPHTDTARPAGVHGYCMGGQLAFRSVEAMPARIGAVGSFHGTGLVTDDPSSPHRAIEGTKAAYLIAIAQDDDRRQPEAKTVLSEAFDAAGRPATVQVFAANHGWCVEGGSTYDRPLSEVAWTELGALYARSLG